VFKLTFFIRLLITITHAIIGCCIIYNSGVDPELVCIFNGICLNMVQYILTTANRLGLFVALLTSTLLGEANTDRLSDLRLSATYAVQSQRGWITLCSGNYEPEFDSSALRMIGRTASLALADAVPQSSQKRLDSASWSREQTKFTGILRPIMRGRILRLGLP